MVSQLTHMLQLNCFSALIVTWHSFMVLAKNVLYSAKDMSKLFYKSRKKRDANIRMMLLRCLKPAIKAIVE